MLLCAVRDLAQVVRWLLLAGFNYLCTYLILLNRLEAYLLVLLHSVSYRTGGNNIVKST